MIINLILIKILKLNEKETDNVLKDFLLYSKVCWSSGALDLCCLDYILDHFTIDPLVDLGIGFLALGGVLLGFFVDATSGQLSSDVRVLNVAKNQNKKFQFKFVKHFKIIVNQFNWISFTLIRLVSSKASWERSMKSLIKSNLKFQKINDFNQFREPKSEFFKNKLIFFVWT